MIAGLLGAHRVGKSTLAYEYALKHNYQYHPISISKLQAEIGFDSNNQSYDFDDRIKIQDHVLKRLAENLEAIDNKGEYIITDRCPLDLIGYTMIHVTEHVTEEQSEWLLQYIQKCIDLTNKHYYRVVLIQPGIPLVTENTTSAVARMGIIEHLNLIYLGISTDPRLRIKPTVFDRTLTDLKERLNQLNKLV